MMDIWRWGPIEGLGWYATVKAFAYLRNNGLIRRTREHRQCHDYVISQKGIEVLYDTLLKRQKLGMTCEIAGICLEADLKTRQISVKTNLNEDTNSSQTVQIPL
jgi:glucokinase